MGIAFVIILCLFLIGAGLGVDILAPFLVFWVWPLLVVPAGIALLIGVGVAHRYRLPRRRR